MGMGKIIIIFFLLSFLCYAEEDKISEFQKTLGENYEIEHTIIIKPRILSEMEKDKKELLRGMTQVDIEIAKRITEASWYACFVKKDIFVLTIEETVMLVKLARKEYDLKKPNISFVRFIGQIVNERYANCDKWIEYYEDWYGK